MNGFLKAGVITASAVTLGLITAGTASADTTVTVESGDTLNQIASDYNTTVDKIASDNAIKNVNLIYVGDTLSIKYGTESVVEPTTTYTQSAPTVYTQPVTTATTTTASSYTSGSTSKDLLINRESGGSYTAQNGRYYGKYQLDISYLNGDLSPANQDATAERYVANRYGSWENAWAHSQETGWY